MLDEGATVPFIARYRKEVTGALDEVAIMAIRDRLLQLEELDNRREAILKSLAERTCSRMSYRRRSPSSKPSRFWKTSTFLPAEASDPGHRCPRKRPRTPGTEDLRPGSDGNHRRGRGFHRFGERDRLRRRRPGRARDIIAEWVNEDQEARTQMRTLFSTKGIDPVPGHPG